MVALKFLHSKWTDLESCAPDKIWLWTSVGNIQHASTDDHLRTNKNEKKRIRQFLILLLEPGQESLNYVMIAWKIDTRHERILKMCGKYNCLQTDVENIASNSTDDELRIRKHTHMYKRIYDLCMTIWTRIMSSLWWLIGKPDIRHEHIFKFVRQKDIKTKYNLPPQTIIWKHSKVKTSA